MKIRILTCLGVAIALVAATNTRANAAGQLSQQSLEAMGLGSLSVMSDDDALAVRGFGFHGSSAKAWGKSWANITIPGGSAGSENGYKAEGKNSASGKNLSFAGVTITHSVGHDGHDGNGGGMGGNPGTTAHTGGDGGHKDGGGKVSVTTIKVFAGGSSSAHSH